MPLAGRRELVLVKPRADVMRRRIRERVVRQQRERAGVVVEELPDEMERPWVFLRAGHGGEPDLPVEPAIVGRDDRRAAHRVARFVGEFVFLPLRVGGDEIVLRALEDDLAALAARRCRMRRRY